MCPCLWTAYSIDRNFRAIILDEPDMSYDLLRIMRLFPE